MLSWSVADDFDEVKCAGEMPVGPTLIRVATCGRRGAAVGVGGGTNRRRMESYCKGGRRKRNEERDQYEEENPLRFRVGHTTILPRLMVTDNSAFAAACPR